MKFKSYKETHKKGPVKEKKSEKKKKVFQNTGTQVNMFINAIDKKEKPSLTELYLNPSSNILSAVRQSKEWNMYILSMVVNDKIITDMHDDFEKRPRQTLITYTAEWFLRRFGALSIAESFSKDFLLSLKTMMLDHERYRLFVDFLGI